MKKWYQKLGKVHKFGKKEEDETKKIKNEEDKTKKDMLSHIYTTVVNLLFTNITISKKFTNDSFTTKQKNLNEFETNLVLFYKETIVITSTNEYQRKYIESRKSLLDKASKLYNTLLKICTNQFNRLYKNKKEKDSY